MIRHFRSFIFLLFSFASCTLPAQDIASILEKSSKLGAFWSVSIRDANGNVLEEFNADKLIIPASNQKLFTAAAVLDGLGSNYRFTTTIYGEGELHADTWIGDLIIAGSGDPSISGIMYDGDKEFVFRSFLQQLNAQGIKNVKGNLWADVSFFDNQIFPKGWDWDDLSFYYGVEINPLSFNNNAVDLIVDANGEIGGQPEISWFPYQTNYVEFDNQQIIARANSNYDEEYVKILGTNQFYLGSSLPQGYLEKESLAISNAHLFFLDSFKKFLLQNTDSSEIESIQQVKGETLPSAKFSILASHTSKPVSKLIEWANKESDNFYTEMLLKTLAAKKRGIPGSFKQGIAEVRDFLGRMQIDTSYVLMKDGSGMASGNLTKTSMLSAFLVGMQNHPEYNAFYNSLSVAGIDGTLAHRIKNTALYNNFRGKTGYVSGVRTLSGYVKTSSGETIIVSIASNNFIGKVRPIDAIQEKILMYVFNAY